MVKEGRTWAAVIQVPRDAGVYRMDVIVAANDFDSAVALVKRTWTKARIDTIIASVYEAVVTGE